MSSPPRGWLAESLRELAPLLGLGIQFALLVLIGVGAGWWIDQRFGFAPWGILIGSVLGIAIAFYHFIRTVLKYTDHRKDRPPSAP